MYHILYCFSTVLERARQALSFGTLPNFRKPKVTELWQNDIFLRFEAPGGLPDNFRQVLETRRKLRSYTLREESFQPIRTAHTLWEQRF